MIARRRARRRPLIRASVLKAVIVRNLSIVDSPFRRTQDQNFARQGGAGSPANGSPLELGYTTPIRRYTSSLSQPELSRYLRQLSALHTAGVLNDEEFAAAKGRLFGS